MIDKNKIPVEVLEVLDKLNTKGYISYLVGGCVRDLLLGKTPKDYDICTVAIPDEIKMVFNDNKVIDTGLKYGTVTVLSNNIPIEVTTFRKDGNYSDGRRPDKVKFGASVLQDIERRDFTINGLLFDGENIHDYTKGKIDLMRRKINTIGKPDDRFKEDALRMMRAIRFSCQLGFTVDPKVLVSIKRNSELIKNVSQERIRDELVKILISNAPVQGINLLNYTDLLKYILPELDKCIGFDQKNKHHCKNVYNHILKVLDCVPNNLEVRLAALLHDIAKPFTFTLGEDGEGHFYGHHTEGYGMTKGILKRLKFDNETINNVSILVKEHMSRYPKLRCSTIKKLINRVGKENMENLINLQIADIIGSKPPYDFKNIIELKKEVERVINEKEPLSLKDLAINGHDLMELGIKPGKELDKLIAEKVFGFWQEDDNWYGISNLGNKCYASVCVPSGNLWGSAVWWNGLPKFSTSIEAAWEIIKKYPMTIVPLEYYNDYDKWNDSVGKPDGLKYGVLNFTKSIQLKEIETNFVYIDDVVDNHMIFDSAPEAICKGVLEYYIER